MFFCTPSNYLVFILLSLFYSVKCICDGCLKYYTFPSQANETPLHFACKFGHVEVVQVLVMHKALDKERVNKYGEKPRDIVCNRMRNGGATIKQEIYNLLSGKQNTV